jgi:hypothetical protein
MQLKKTKSSIQNAFNKAVKNVSANGSGRSLLYNKYVLYTVFGVCIINILSWLFSGDLLHVAIFLLIGYLTSNFSKNMIVVLVIALVVSNIVKSGIKIAVEGMTNKEDNKGDSKNKNVKPTKKESIKNKKDKEGLTDKYEKENEDEEHEEKEGLEELDEQPCAADSDCEKGYMCNSNFICEKKSQDHM